MGAKVLQGQQIGRYHLLTRLGRGGMGEVFLAEDERIAQKVAIKLVRNEASDMAARAEEIRLFQREAMAIARLDHPNILQLYDYGEQVLDGVAFSYLVMAYRPEGSLSDWLRRRSTGSSSPSAPSGISAGPALSLRDIAHIINQAADALQHAHEHQILHQDVKPSNFLIRARKEQPNRPDVLLADFGIARIYAATSHVSQHVRGTPAYMAPEQWEGRPVPASDQYALAIMAYQLLVGHPPFQGRLEQVMHQHFSVQPPAPTTLNPRLPKDVDIVLLHALAKRPEQRFASMTAFARAFQQAVTLPDGQDSQPLPIVDVSSRPSHSGAQFPAVETPSQSGGVASVSDSNPFRSGGQAGAEMGRPYESAGGMVAPSSVPSIPGVPLTPHVPLTPAHISLSPSTLDQAANGDIFVTLAITPEEAMRGTTRTLTFSPGRYVNVSLPPGVYEGQVLRLEHQGNPSSYGSPSAPASVGTPGALILRLTIKARDDGPVIPPPPPPPTVVVRDNRSVQSISAANQPRGISRERIILLVGIVLLIIIASSGVLFAANATSAYVSDTNMTATASYKMASALDATMRSNATSTAAATTNSTTTFTGATATAQAANNATATVLAHGPSPYGGTLVLDDPLKDNSQGHRWQEFSDSYRSCRFSHGAYLNVETKTGFYNPCMALTMDLTDCAIQVKMTMLTGDNAGVFLRGAASPTQGYYIYLGVNGTYSFALTAADGKFKALKDSLPLSGNFHSGYNQSNVIAVVVRGNTLTLYVNQQRVDAVTDGTFSHGLIGLASDGTNQASQVSFSDVKVWKL